MMSITPVNTKSEPLLVGDVGGTNVRLAIYQNDDCHDIEVFSADDYDSLEMVMKQYLTQLADKGRQPVRAAVLDIATPIDDDYVKLTNRPEWAFSIKEMTKALAFDWVHVINDFTALALSIPLLQDKDVLAISPNAQSQNINQDGNIALIGPGTGLGVSGLVETGEGYLPISGEGGHVTYSGNEGRELQITQYLHSHYGHVSAERLLSGMGICNIYQAICHIEQTSMKYTEAKEISEAAEQESDVLAVETMRHYFNILGTVTGNLALTLGAFAGVYLGGGILPKIERLLLDSEFYPRYLAHGRFNNYLAEMPIYLIKDKYAALKGCAATNNPIYRHLGVYYIND